MKLAIDRLQCSSLVHPGHFERYVAISIVSAADSNLRHVMSSAVFHLQDLRVICCELAHCLLDRFPRPALRYWWTVAPFDDEIEDDFPVLFISIDVHSFLLVEVGIYYSFCSFFPIL